FLARQVQARPGMGGAGPGVDAHQADPDNWRLGILRGADVAQDIVLDRHRRRIGARRDDDAVAAALDDVELDDERAHRNGDLDGGGGETAELVSENLALTDAALVEAAGDRDADGLVARLAARQRQAHELVALDQGAADPAADAVAGDRKHVVDDGEGSGRRRQAERADGD